MLFKAQTLARIASGEVDLAFRRWPRARVKVGTRLRTAVGVLEVVAVDVVAMARITEREARRAGCASRAELVALLRGGRGGRVHRVRLRPAGADPRVALRARSRMTRAERDELGARLARLDAAAEAPWVEDVLRTIERRPAVRAPDLAAAAGQETRRYKARVRRLKELGLTESLEVGYRLSSRGRAWLRGARRD